MCIYLFYASAEMSIPWIVQRHYVFVLCIHLCAYLHAPWKRHFLISLPSTLVIFWKVYEMYHFVTSLWNKPVQLVIIPASRQRFVSHLGVCICLQPCYTWFRFAGCLFKGIVLQAR